jgi:hypothetical protein
MTETGRFATRPWTPEDDEILLTNAAERGGPVEFARIATLQAINRHIGQVFNPSRKDTHWGKRKLKRDTP